MASSMMNASYVKPAAAAGVAFLIDKYVLNNQDTQSSLYFAGASGAGILAADLLSPYLPDISKTVSTTAFYNANTVEKRLLEIGMSAAVGYGVNHFLLKNTGYNEDTTKRIAAIAVADFISEYITDYMTAQPLSYLI